MLAKMIKLGLILVISLLCTFLMLNNLYIDIFFRVVSIVFWIHILGSDKNYSSKMLWLVVLFFNPFLGIMLYIVFGHSYKEKEIFTRKNKTDKIFDQYIGDIRESVLKTDENRILKNLGHASFYQNTKFEILQNGDEKFPRFLECIESATDHIHIEYYIYRDGKITTQINDILRRKAKDGVDVRLMYDDVGSKKLSKEEIKSLKDAGVKIKAFGVVRIPFLSNQFNFRNHRKILVVDNKYGFIGGLNIADEYAGFITKFGFWRDTHMCMSGEAVRDLQITFAKDWYYETGENFILENESRYLKVHSVNNSAEEVQIIASGPDNKGTSIEDIYFKLLTNAKHRIIIMTPYFIPGQDIVKALITSAKNGVIVDIIVPGVPDYKAVHAVTRTYYDELLKAGINIYERTGSFVHGKVLVIDDQTSAVGTTNMDFRSFQLNFEITAFISSIKISERLINDLDNDISVSKKISKKDWDKRPIIDRYAAAILQFFSPLL